MSEEKKEAQSAPVKPNPASRRNFIAGTVGGLVVGAVVGAAAGSVGFPRTVTQTETSTTSVVNAFWLPAKWDYEADVVVVGYGGAGAASAITAAENGASVIVLEKSPQKGQCNTAVASGHLQWSTSASGTAQYIFADGLGTLDMPTATAVAGYLADLPAWLSAHNIPLGSGEPTSATAAAGFPGANTYTQNGMVQSHVGAKEGVGRDLFQYLDANVTTHSNIQIMLSTPATGLVQNPQDKMVLGVQASSNGSTINVKANKAVIMALGGYENSRALMSVFNDDNEVPIYPAGTPYNTGDGIYMATAAGAQLWHFDGFEYGYFGFMPTGSVPGVSPNAAFWLQPGLSAVTTQPQDAYIIVNSAGNRFHNESVNYGHIKTKPEPLTVNTSGSGIAGLWPNYPFWMIMDNTVLTAGPVGGWEPHGYPYVGYNFAQGYVWSQDNSTEVAAGWIMQADTIADLATAAGISPSGLTAQVNAYNGYCAAKVDSQFGRTASTLQALTEAPFSAIQMCITMINTQGGPKHNASCQIVDPNNNAIPHFYAAGEFGSYYGFLYEGSNLTENLVDGQIAGKAAAAETPWTGMG